MIECAAMDDRRGFTLIELLAVVAIIALLTGILSPSLGSVRQRARSVLCGLNLKQLGLAASVYEEAHGTFCYGFDDSPAAVELASSHTGNPTRDRMGKWWFDQLDGIVGEASEGGTVWCPSRSFKEPGGRANVLCGNYGSNRAVFPDALARAGSEFAGRPPGLGQIRHPTGTLLLVDSGYALISWLGAADNILQRFENAAREEAFYLPGLSINNNRVFSGMFAEDALEGRHPGKTVNAAYADGRVESVAAERLLVEQVGSSWQNRSPLWLP